MFMLNGENAIVASVLRSGVQFLNKCKCFSLTYTKIFPVLVRKVHLVRMVNYTRRNLLAGSQAFRKIIVNSLLH